MRTLIITIAVLIILYFAFIKKSTAKAAPEHKPDAKPKVAPKAPVKTMDAKIKGFNVILKKTKKLLGKASGYRLGSKIEVMTPMLPNVKYVKAPSIFVEMAEVAFSQNQSVPATKVIQMQARAV